MWATYLYTVGHEWSKKPLYRSKGFRVLPIEPLHVFLHVSPLDRVRCTTELSVYGRHAFVVSTLHVVPTVQPVSVMKKSTRTIGAVGMRGTFSWPFWVPRLLYVCTMSTVFLQYVFSVSIHYLCSISTVSTVYLHYVYSISTVYIYSISTVYVYSISTICLQYIHSTCLQYVYKKSTVSIKYLYSICTVCLR